MISPLQQTYFFGLLILCDHLVSLFLSFFPLQLLSGQRVTVVVSRQQAEVAVFLRVKVETRQLFNKTITHTFFPKSHNSNNPGIFPIDMLVQTQSVCSYCLC